MPRWSVDIIRKKAEHLGTVEAPDDKAAIKEETAHFQNSRASAQTASLSRNSMTSGNEAQAPAR